MKKNNQLEYKGYRTTVEFDNDSKALFGKIEGIKDLVTFECENPKDAETEFHNAVDEYLEFCNEVGKTPEKEYRGVFNVRIPPTLHERLACLSYENGDTLNSSVEKAIQQYVASGGAQWTAKQAAPKFHKKYCSNAK